MAAELDLLSLSQLQNLSHHQSQPNHHHHPNPNLMWNPNKAEPHDEEAPAAAGDEDDSWEVRAFAEDTGNAMGTTWPPRSYTCTFCRREFRSAQALGGHMNVHRRDRARLHHQTHPPPLPPATALINNNRTSSALLIPTHQDFTANGGFCLLYQLPTAPAASTGGEAFTSPTYSSSHSAALLSISPYPLMAPPSISFPAGTAPPGGRLFNSVSSSSSSLCYSTKAEPSRTLGDTNNIDDDGKYNETSSSIEELDLELRLGHRPTTS